MHIKFCLYIRLCTTCVPDAKGGQKRVSGFPGARDDCELPYRC